MANPITGIKAAVTAAEELQNVRRAVRSVEEIRKSRADKIESLNALAAKRREEIEKSYIRYAEPDERVPEIERELPTSWGNPVEMAPVLANPTRNARITKDPFIDEDHVAILQSYTGTTYRFINRILRHNKIGDREKMLLERSSLFFSTSQTESVASDYRFFKDLKERASVTTAEKDIDALQEELVDAYVSNMDEVIHNQSLPQDMILYRGLGGDHLQRVVELGDRMVGREISFPSYVSTSARRTVGLNWSDGNNGSIGLRIHVPKGSPALDVEAYMYAAQRQFKDKLYTIDSVHKSENEFILPRDSKFRVVGMERDGLDEGRIKAILDLEYIPNPEQTRALGEQLRLRASSREVARMREKLKELETRKDFKKFGPGLYQDDATGEYVIVDQSGNVSKSAKVFDDDGT